MARAMTVAPKVVELGGGGEVGSSGDIINLHSDE